MTTPPQDPQILAVDVTREHYVNAKPWQADQQPEPRVVREAGEAAKTEIHVNVWEGEKLILIDAAPSVAKLIERERALTAESEANVALLEMLKEYAPAGMDLDIAVLERIKGNRAALALHADV